jgi:hypothetical protein
LEDAVIPTADAKVNCRTQPDGDIACAGGEGDTGTTDGPGGNVNRGHGGHSVTDADAGETTSQGGGGAHVSDEGENFGGGEGGRCTSEGCVGGGPGLPTD